jgi:hypothetical protein
VEVVQKLLEAGADPNRRTARGETALARASARSGSAEPDPQMIQLLKQAGAR